ncbi:hypothetical protein [Salmonella enterica]|uniref:hypothetical protein n=1 Tax=Salmonella enterica TaxID=28901 RepID=UPI00209AA1D0|nr:hypothetical protein [Salmonella enterica]
MPNLTSTTGCVHATAWAIASVVSAGRYYAGVYKTDPENIDILGLTVSRDGSSWTTAVTFGIDEIPVLDVSNIGVKLQEA